jgi:protein-disulfide isomerase
MAKKSHGTKIAAVVVVLLIAAVVGFGYFKQSSKLSADDSAVASPAPIDTRALTMKPSDIYLGDVNALVTIVEYSSLSCPHCKHFHEKVLPDVEKEFITTGKAKLIIRHFPLNAPALKGAQLVECSGGDAGNGGSRSDFIKILFNMQEKWAFNEDYLKNLKQIAATHGMGSAVFESCMNNKDLETKILNSRQEASDKLRITSTPSFFVNGVQIKSVPTIEALREAINAAVDTAK